MAEALFRKVALKIETTSCGRLSIAKTDENLPCIGASVPEAVRDSVVNIHFESLEDCIRVAHNTAQGRGDQAWDVLLQHANIETGFSDLKQRLLKHELRSPSPLRKQAKKAFTVFLYVRLTAVHKGQMLDHTWCVFGEKVTKSYEETKSIFHPTDFEVITVSVGLCASTKRNMSMFLSRCS